MLETLKEFAIALTLAIVCGLGAYILKTKKQNILDIIRNLVNDAEDKINGSNMGAEKKAIVIAQLESMNIKVTDKVSGLIDGVVNTLNEKSGWFKDKATNSGEEIVSQTVTDVQDATDSIVKTVEDKIK